MGHCPFRRWYRSLDSHASTKIDTVLAKLELGVHSKIKWFRGIGEYVLDWGPGYRIYLMTDGTNLIVLFGGGTKSGQQKDIEQALIYAKLYKARKKK